MPCRVWFHRWVRKPQLIPAGQTFLENPRLGFPLARLNLRNISTKVPSANSRHSQSQTAPNVLSNGGVSCFYSLVYIFCSAGRRIPHVFCNAVTIWRPNRSVTFIFVCAIDCLQTGNLSFDEHTTLISGRRRNIFTHIEMSRRATWQRQHRIHWWQRIESWCLQAIQKHTMLLTFRVLVFLVIFETVQQRLEQSFIEHACDLYTPAVNTISLFCCYLSTLFHYLLLLLLAIPLAAATAMMMTTTEGGGKVAERGTDEE